MIPQDTSIGGMPGGFPSTGTELGRRFGDPAAENYRAAMQVLCERYWKPVYGYARMAWAKSNEDAKDLTQAFFLWLLEGEALRKFDPALGSFRTFLKVLLKRFIGHQDEALSRLKRGGGVRIQTLEGASADAAPDPRAADPEDAFEKLWLTELVQQAVDRTLAAERAKGRDLSVRVYEAYDLCTGAPPPTYEELAAKFQTTETDIRRHLCLVREAVAREIREELIRLTSNDDELRNEWNIIFRPGK